jgi:hypothetical protein
MPQIIEHSPDAAASAIDESNLAVNLHNSLDALAGVPSGDSITLLGLHSPELMTASSGSLFGE